METLRVIIGTIVWLGSNWVVNNWWYTRILKME